MVLKIIQNNTSSVKPVAGRLPQRALALNPNLSDYLKRWETFRLTVINNWRWNIGKDFKSRVDEAAWFTDHSQTLKKLEALYCWTFLQVNDS